MMKAKKDENVNYYYTNRHAVYLLQYHLVVVTKYRHKVITLTSHHFYTSIKNVRKNRLISPVFLLLLQIYDNQLLLSLTHSVSSSVCS